MSAGRVADAIALAQQELAPSPSSTTSTRRRSSSRRARAPAVTQGIARQLADQQLGVTEQLRVDALGVRASPLVTLRQPARSRRAVKPREVV
jgi:hypothetical protein